jgi:hypothetical protein
MNKRSVLRASHVPLTRRSRVEELGRRLVVTLAPLLELASSPTLVSTDERIGPTSERPAAVNAITLGPRVLLAIRGSTLGVQTLPVAVAPVFRRRPVTAPAMRRDAEVHPPVARELLERKPFGAACTALLRHVLNVGHCFCATFCAERFSRGKLVRGARAHHLKKRGT